VIHIKECLKDLLQQTAGRQASRRTVSEEGLQAQGEESAKNKYGKPRVEEEDEEEVTRGKHRARARNVIRRISVRWISQGVKITLV
jgi:hypothetical protein